MLLLICVILSSLAVMLAAAFFEDTDTYYLLAAQELGIFLLPAYIAMRLVHRRALTRLGLRHTPAVVSILCVIPMSLLILPFVALTAGLNAALPLPEWMVEMEKNAQQFTQQLLTTPTWQGLWLNMAWVAAAPAVAEEIFFRGFLQNTLHRWMRRPHWAIFITAAVFSAFHLQFMSFLPRLFLGLTLGYLFHWSRSLWLPIAAHFLNNAMAVCAYFYDARNGEITDFDTLGQMVSRHTIFIASAVFMAALLMVVIYYFEHKKRIDNEVKKMEQSILT